MKVNLMPSTLFISVNGQNIPFVNHVKYFMAIFDKSIKWRLYMEMIKDKAIRTFIRVYFLFKRVIKH
jgi:hypothetical protein